MRVERRGEEYLIAVPREALDAMHLAEGAEVQVLPVEVAKNPIRYLSVEEALTAYRKTEPQHHEAYRELAK
jgi:antitoxin component of MazEF toxin-antitoxin module